MIVGIINVCKVILVLLTLLMLLVIFDETLTCGWFIAALSFSTWVICHDDLYLVFAGLLAIAGSVDRAYKKHD